MMDGTPQAQADAGDGGFWRLRHDHLAAILSRRDLSWESARVYLALADLTQGYGRERDVVSFGQIAERAAVDRAHVARALKHLSALGLYGQTPAGGQKMTRWVVWPAPPVAQAGNSAEGGNASVAGAGNGTVAGAVARAGKHQDTEKEKNAKTGTSPAAGGFCLRPPEGGAQGDGAAGRLVAQWIEGHRKRTGGPITDSARGRLAGTIKDLLRTFTPDDLGGAIGRWFGQDRQSFSMGLFRRKLEDGDADITGRAVRPPNKGRTPDEYANGF